jgi:hypothetical protein
MGVPMIKTLVLFFAMAATAQAMTYPIPAGSVIQTPDGRVMRVLVDSLLVVPGSRVEPVRRPIIIVPVRPQPVRPQPVKPHR